MFFVTALGSRGFLGRLVKVAVDVDTALEDVRLKHDWLGAPVAERWVLARRKHRYNIGASGPANLAPPFLPGG